MAERRYRIVLQIDTKAADAAAARGAANQKKVADAVKGIAKAFDDVVPKIEVGYYKLAAAGLKFQDQMARAADKAARDADKLADRQTRAADKAADAKVRASERAAAQSQRAAEKEARDADKLAERRTRAADKAADAAARASQKAADAEARRVDKEARDADKLAARQTRAADKAADAAARASQKAADADARRIDKEARDADRLAERQTRAADRAADKAARDEQKKADRLQAIQDRYLKRDYDAAVANEQKKLKAAAEAAEKAKEKANQAAKESSDFRREITLAAIAVAGGTIVSQFVAVSEQVYAAKKMVEEYHQALLELAAIKGNTGNTGPELAENLRFRAQTLMSRDESVAFQSAARNTGMSSVLSAEAAKDPSRRGITEGEFTKGLALVGALNTTRGEDPKSAGELAGIIPMTLKGQSKADDVYKEYVRLNQTFQPGGASVPSLIKQYTKNIGLVTSGVMGKEEASALLSSLSVSKTEEAGTTMESLVKATMGSLDRKRGMGIMGGMSQGAYFKDLGVTKDMGVTDITRMVVADMEKYQKADMAAGGSGNLENFLTHKGFVNQHERDAMRTMFGQMTSGAVDDQGQTTTGMFDRVFVKAATTAPDIEAEQKKVAAAQRANPALRKRQEDLMSATADVASLTPADQTYYRLQKAAFEKLKVDKVWGVTGQYDNFQKGWNLANPGQWYGGAKVNAEMGRIMTAERQKVGLNSFDEFSANYMKNVPLASRGDLKNEDIYHASVMELESKGSDFSKTILGGLLDKATEQLTEAQKLTRAFEAFTQQQQGKGPAAPPNVRPGP